MATTMIRSQRSSDEIVSKMALVRKKFEAFRQGEHAEYIVSTSKKDSVFGVVSTMADLSKGVKLACEDYNRRLYLGKAQVCSSPSRARTRTPSTIIFSTKETASASPKEETE
ncbi:hypothetical protein Bca101_050352 [Brassica carinata]